MNVLLTRRRIDWLQDRLNGRSKRIAEILKATNLYREESVRQEIDALLDGLQKITDLTNSITVTTEEAENGETRRASAA